MSEARYQATHLSHACHDVLPISVPTMVCALLRDVHGPSMVQTGVLLHDACAANASADRILSSYFYLVSAPQCVLTSATQPEQNSSAAWR